MGDNSNPRRKTWGKGTGAKMKLCCSEDALIQNLRDAGCDEEKTAACLSCMKSNRETECLRLLKKHRSGLLDTVHEEQKKIDCLDYLLYQMKKTKGEQ